MIYNVGGKINGLESARGLASLVVVIWHISLAFHPGLSGIFEGFEINNSLLGSPFYALINGSAAVVFFFVLSGYVLSRSFLNTGEISILRRNAIKRLPRLAFLTVTVCLISYILFSWEIYQYSEAGEITQSPWLIKFGYAFDEPFVPNILDAAIQGLYLTFYVGDSYYNSSMWTMKIEFFGSLLVFGTAALIGNDSRPVAGAMILVLASSVAISQSPYYLAFVVGTGLAWIIPVTPPKLGRTTALIFIGIVFFLYGYTGISVGMYKFIGVLSHSYVIYLWITSSGILIFLIERSNLIRIFLDRRSLNFLGQISFALYLIHVPVICSVGSWVYIYVGGGSPSNLALITSSVATIIISIGSAYILTVINNYWLKGLNFAVSDISSSKGPAK